MPNYNSNLQINNTSLQEILNAVNELPDASGGIELPELTNEGIASDLLAGKELIDGDGNKVTGTMPTGSAKTPATTITKTPSISVNSSGLITAFVSGTQTVTPTISAGYVSSGTAGTITVSGSATKQLTTQAAKTITPTTSSQTAVVSGRYTTGAVTVAGDSNLIAENIVQGKSIFGVVGTAVAGGVEDPFDTSLFTYTINSVDGATYGFALNDNGYYESQNKGQNTSYAICRINLMVKTACNITFDVINYAESNYDYALFSNLDTALNLSNSADSTNVKKSFKGLQSANVVNVIYENVTVGSHTIDIKFIKDTSQHSNNDSVQFKIQELNGDLSQDTIDKIVAADEDLIPKNIKSGVDIFGVVGTYAGGDTSDATATADEIFAGETAYGADGKLTGTFTIDNELADEGNLLRQLQNALKGKAIPLPISKKDINFYDYDGTLLYSYTMEEAQALTELPLLPTQPGLICQEWNYDLETIKSYNRAMNIGATYITDDGKTRLYIKIAAEGRMTIPLYFSQTVSNGVTIDWGDGSATETLSSTGNVNTSHTYTQIGDYIISLDVVNGCTLELGNGSDGIIYSTKSSNEIYCAMLQKVEIGNGIHNINAFTFYRCWSLSSITIPNNVTSINGGYVFSNCTSLSNIVIPNSVTSISGERIFQNCDTLSNVIIPEGITSICEYFVADCGTLSNIIIPNGVTNFGEQTFTRCYSLISIMIPNSVTSIETRAFSGCSGMAIYDFTSHTSIPVLEDSYVFHDIPSDCEIRVPAALYDDWRTSTNWIRYASQIVAV